MTGPNLDPVKLVGQRVDDDEHVAELGRQDSSAVVSPVLRPDDVDLVVAQVARLAQQALLGVGRHPGNNQSRHIVTNRYYKVHLVYQAMTHRHSKRWFKS